MIRAGFLAFGHAAIAILDDSTKPARLVAVNSWDTEKIDPGAVVAELLAAGVVRLALDTTGAPAPALALTEAVRAMSLSAGIEVVDVPHMARKGAKGQVASIAGWPAKPTVYQLQAAALALADISPPPAKPAPAAKPLERALEESVEAEEQKTAETTAEPPTGRRTLAIDPGSAKLGAVVAVGDVAPLHVVARRTFDVGQEVQLPRAIKTASGRRTYTRDRVLTWDMIGALAESVIGFALEHGVTDAIVERVVFTFGTPTRDLIRTAEVSAVIAERLRAIGIKVTMESATIARNRTAKKAKDETWDAAVSRAVTAGFVQWPAKGSDTHQRDAGLYALYRALPPAPVRAARAPSEKGAVKDPRDRTKRARPAREKAKLEAIAMRALAGCSCKLGGRHQAGCPLQDSNKKGGRPRTTAAAD